MNMKIFASGELLALVIWGCDKKEPVEPPREEEPKPSADFTFTQVSEDDPFTFRFDNASTNFVVSRWEFGDDSTSIEESPTHTFLKTGIFTVKLRTENSEKYWAQKEFVIRILPDSLVRLTASAAQPGYLNVGFNALMPLEQVRWYKVE